MGAAGAWFICVVWVEGITPSGLFQGEEVGSLEKEAPWGFAFLKFMF